MATPTPEWHNEVWEIFHNYMPIMHVSGIIDNQARSDAKARAINKLTFKLSPTNRLITEDSDYEEEVKKVFSEIYFNKKGIAELGDHVKHNLLYNKEPFAKYEISHDKVSAGAHYLANNFAHKNLKMGIIADDYYELLKNELTKEEIDRRTSNLERRSWMDYSFAGDQSPDIMSTKLDEDLTRDSGLPEMTHPDLVDGEVRLKDPTGEQEHVKYQTMQERLLQQTLDDIMAGNAENIYTALIPASEGGEGYYIGIFYRDPNKSSGEHTRLGVMQNENGSTHVVTNDELVGASASNQLIEYLASWWFDYKHENLKELYEKGKAGVPAGPGRAVERDIDIWTPIKRSAMFAFTDMEELEFKHAVEPLYLMMEKKAKEIHGDKYVQGETFLTEEESQDVLRLFADRFNRGYSKATEKEPLSYVRGAARWVANFWEFDFNLSEVWK